MANREFNNSQMNRFTEQTQRILRLAQELDWSLQWANDRMHVLNVTAPGHRKTFNVPTTNVNHNRLKSWVSALWTHSDKAKWGAIIHGDQDMMADPLLASVVAVVGTAISTAVEKENTVESRLDEDERARIERVREAAERAEARLAQASAADNPVMDRGDPPAPTTAEVWGDPDDVEWRRAPEYDAAGSEWWTARIEDRVHFECRASTHAPYRTGNTRSRGSHTANHHDTMVGAKAKSGVTRHERRIIETIPWRRESDGAISVAVLDEVRADGSHTYLCAQCKKFRSTSPRAVGGHTASHGRKDAPKAPTAVLDETEATPDSVTESSSLLDAVRSLLGGGDQAERILDLEAEVERLTSDLDRWRTRAERAESEMSALADLVNSVTKRR